MNIEQMFTCLSCSIAFLSAEEQRVHYRSDHHRYNMKRRVASLPPVSLALFVQKVTERKTETAVTSSSKGSTCEICNKSYTTENAYRSHINSKKHKETEAKAQLKPSPQQPSVPEDSTPASAPEAAGEEDSAAPVNPVRLTVDEDASEEQINQTIDEKIAAARSRLSPSHCLFCPHVATSIDDNLTHMSTSHSFFIPDAEYLIDIPGLLTYLGEKIAVGNVCIYCNGKGREFRTLDAVRKHMVDKTHCKIAYDSEPDRLEISDYYDFTTSYPDAEPRKRTKRLDRADNAAPVDGEWEDVEDSDEGSVDEVVEEDASDSDSEESYLDDLPDNQITYGDSHLELVLPSGARIGHRSLRRYYAQSFPTATRNGKSEDPNSGAALVRRLLAEKNSALVPRRGGFGAFGSGTEVVKARNHGEAKEAGRHVREFRDQKRREDFKTKIGYRNNYQKHFRDPLLQVCCLPTRLRSPLTSFPVIHAFSYMVVFHLYACRADLAYTIA
ncbi:hypothetical protein JAAARDRAFT_130649 [Jaapia argillacea MUCL 33604]|uniref:C2H2-type domain-containing protein n=1 Tax=Jaapia argillacea MUCL 33604 TaxID=933084 RepID=A0A067PUM2_9AGAM|nr:hypothetical protein JAAARDRAFT_130649 [Jaapia argillacea MUCL 33604]